MILTNIGWVQLAIIIYMTRSMGMQQMIMKNIMRLVVAGSMVAITVNIIMIFG